MNDEELQKIVKSLFSVIPNAVPLPIIVVKPLSNKMYEYKKQD